MATSSAITFNGQAITDKLDIFIKAELPWIATLTLNGRTGREPSLANQVQEDLRNHMHTQFSHVARETEKFIVDRSEKRNLVTTIKHKDQAPKGTPPSEYLKPQIVGGPVKRQRFQKSLAERTSRMSRSHFMMPIKNDRPGFGEVKGGEYQRALWGISAMEQFRGTERFIGQRNYRTAGSYIQVKYGLGKWAQFDPAVRPEANMIRALNEKAGNGFKLPSAGIYKVNSKSLKQVFQELDYIPQAKRNHYRFKFVASISVNKNFERIFRQKVKEVMG